MSVIHKAEKGFSKAGRGIKLAAQRLADKHVSLAVTGLSRSGKSAFITSLVNQLTTLENPNLPFFSVHRENRLLGVIRDQQPDVTVARYPYEQSINGLTDVSPQWPVSTRGVSQLRLKLKYRHTSSVRKVISETSTLTLDVTDYPGEWLLDLPLLEMTFQQWCEDFWRQQRVPGRAVHGAEFNKFVDTISTAECNDVYFQRGYELYAAYLQECRVAGFHLLQPGRFVLPGELDGAPVLHFFPLSEAAFNQGKGENTQWFSELERRFESYKKRVVKPFYHDFFSGFDRQIVLADCLGALNRGQHSFVDMQHAINWLLGSFHYGTSNVLKRLFSPKIDKLIFAASKADHVSVDQQENLVKLLDSIVSEARQQIQYEGVKTESTAIAAIRASSAGKIRVDGEEYDAIKGNDQSGNPVSLFPGDVPTKCPTASFWEEREFTFPEFRPPLVDVGQALPHLRMDQILEFVLGDKMR